MTNEIGVLLGHSVIGHWVIFFTAKLASYAEPSGAARGCFLAC